MRVGAYLLVVATVSASVSLALAPTSSASSACLPPQPAPSNAVRKVVEIGGFTYTGTICTPYGWGYVAWWKGTADAAHPTNRKRVLIETRSERAAHEALAYYRSGVGRLHFLRKFRLEVSSVNPQWSFSVRLERHRLEGATLTLQASSRASLRP